MSLLAHTNALRSGATNGGNAISLANFKASDREWLGLLDDAFIGGALACVSAYNSFKEDEENNPKPPKHAPGMPIDFVPIGAKFEMADEDPTPLEDRKNHILCLHRGLDQDAVAAISGCDNEKVNDKIQSFRKGIHSFGDSSSQNEMVNGTVSAFPDRVKLRGCAIRSIADFLAWIRIGGWSLDKQEVVAHATVTMWGIGNQWAINKEQELADMLGIQFLDIKSNGKKMLKQPQGKCFSRIIVKAKGSQCTKIRNTTRRHFRIAVYARNEGDVQANQDIFSHPKRALEGMKIALRKAESRRNELIDNGKKDLVRKLLPALIVQVPATHDEDRFKGLIGHCEGHECIPKLMANLESMCNPGPPPTVTKTPVSKSPLAGQLASVSLSESASFSISSPLTVSTLSTQERKSNGHASELQLLLESKGIKSIAEVKQLLEGYKPASLSEDPASGGDSDGDEAETAKDEENAKKAAKRTVNEEPENVSAEANTSKTTTSEAVETPAPAADCSEKRSLGEVTEEVARQLESIKLHEECDHRCGFMAEYKTRDDRKCFEAGHQKRCPFFPRHCQYVDECGVKCSKLLVSRPANGPIDPEMEFRVALESPAYLCKCGANSSTECMFCVCTPCYKKLKPPGPSPKRRRVQKRDDVYC